RRRDLLADIARLIEIPMIEFVGLRLLHRLHDVVVFDLADAEKGREERNRDRDSRAEIAVSFLGGGLVRGVRRRFHRVNVQGSSSSVANGYQERENERFLYSRIHAHPPSDSKRVNLEWVIG